MHQFKLGPKAIQEIKRFEAVLDRFPRAERLSMLRYLQQSVSVGSTTVATGGRGVVRSINTARKATRSTTTSSRGPQWSSRQAKLSRVAKRRARDANGHFIPAGKRSTRARARAA